MRLRLISRASALARLQADLVRAALASARPGLPVDLVTRSSAGDRDRTSSIWQSTEKGLFTSDLSDSLVAGEAEVAVHSLKDLPIEGRPDTTVAAILARADPRDVLLVRPDALRRRPSELSVLTSSPRRAWQLTSAVADLLPWRVSAVTPGDVRGNIPTRLEKLLAGDSHALVVAKAALDRLLSEAADSETRRSVRALLDQFVWMVLPISLFPTAPAQGAVAAEVAAARTDVLDLLRSIDHGPTRAAVEAERAMLAVQGGGCHSAIGVTVLVREYGTITSARGLLPSGDTFARWSLDSGRPLPPSAGTLAPIWPRPDERGRATRRSLPAVVPLDDRGWWVSRADALPPEVATDERRIVWAAGTETWRRLASRGVWVHGCADGLGDLEQPDIDALAGRSVGWLRLSHADSGADDALATYEVRAPLPPDLPSRTHFFWSSGSLFLEALSRHPEIGTAWHGCGPGRTFRTISGALGDDSRVSIWLDYEQWRHHVTK